MCKPQPSRVDVLSAARLYLALPSSRRATWEARCRRHGMETAAIHAIVRRASRTSLRTTAQADAWALADGVRLGVAAIVYRREQALADLRADVSRLRRGAVV